MPIREEKVLDKKDGKPLKDAEGNYITTPEKFCKCFLADTEEEVYQLMEEYEKHISFLAGKFAMQSGVSREYLQQDLQQEGLIGLARAKRDFEGERSDNFRIFAIYKIKDAMREYVSTQGRSLRTPQYIMDALRLINNLKAIMSKAKSIEYLSPQSIWELSETFKCEESIMKEVNKIRGSLLNLADRSHAPIGQLLERVELMPTTSIEMTDYNVANMSAGPHEEEDQLIERLSAKNHIGRLKGFLTEDEFDLLYARFVEGKTLEELEPVLKIKAESIVVKTNKILGRLERNKNKILKRESHANTKKTEQGHGG